MSEGESILILVKRDSPRREEEYVRKEGSFLRQKTATLSTSPSRGGWFQG